MLGRGLERWGRRIREWRYVILVAWVLVIVLSGWLSTRYADVLSGGGWEIPGSETQHAHELLGEKFAGRSASSMLLVYQDKDNDAESDDYRENLKGVIYWLGLQQGVESVYSILNAADVLEAGMIGSDRHTTYAFVNLSLEEDYAVNEAPKMQERLNHIADELGVKSYLIGPAALWGDVSKYSQQGLVTAEMIVLPIIFVILLLVFRSVVAALTPMVVTIAAVSTGLGVIYWVGSMIELSVFVTNSAIMLGMGLSIDYSLFMVSRFRAELEKHHHVKDALGIALRTSGHTVLFSGITVIAAMLAMFVVDIPAIRAIAFGAIVVVVFAVLATLSLLPAVLAMLGTRINKWRIPSFYAKRSRPLSFWSGWAKAIMRRPVLFLVVSIAVMAMLTIPVTKMKLNTNDITILPEESPARLGFEMYEKAFATGGNSSSLITLHVKDGKVTDEQIVAYIDRLQVKLGELPDVHRVTSVASFTAGMEPAGAAAFLQAGPDHWPQGFAPMINRYMSKDGHYAVIDLTIGSTGASDESKELISNIRSKVIPDTVPPAGVEFALGGDTPTAMDMNDAIYSAIVPILLVMLALIYLILLVTFRSLLLPLKAIIMNLFSVGATFGVVTWVFGLGHGVEIFGATADGYIANFIPILMMSLLFGLSTDYEVFLISRVKEHYEETRDNEESVAFGLQVTGPLITGAALLMIAVFTGFAFSSMLPIQTLGFGMAVAIFLDATIVRIVIVPAAMKLMGKWNWWLPAQRS